MSKPTRILIVEDLVSDFELAQLEIRKSVSDCLFEQVETRQDFLNALETFQPDVILSDYSLPRFDGMTALKLTKEHAPLTPFIIWTGSISEEVAADCMKAGANNYILKENIERLGSAVVHALDERQLLLERKEAEDNLRRSESKYRALTENSLQGIAIFQNSRMVYANPAICAIMGYTAKELMEMSEDQIMALTHPDDRATAQERTRKHQAGESVSASNDLRIIRKDSTIRWIQIFSKLIEYNGQPAVLSTSIDITEHKQAEEKYQAIFANSADGIYQSTPDGRYLNANPALARIYGYDSPQEMIKTVTDIARQIYVDPDDRKKFLSIFKTADSIANFEMKNYRKDGSIIWTSSSARAVRDADDKVLYYEGFLRDITQRKQAEENLRGQEKRFRSLIENSLDNISLLAADGTLLWENPAVNRTLGYEQDEFVDRNIFELMHPDDMGWTGDLFSTVVREPGSQQRGTFRLKHHDGTWRWIEATATNMLNEPSVNAIVINYRDVTGRKLAEINIQQRNADLQLINTINEMALRDEGLDGIVNLLAKELKNNFSTTGSTLYLLSPDGSTLTMQQYFLPPEVARRIEKIIGSTIPLIQLPIQDGGFFQKVLNSQHGSITNDRDEIEKWMAEFINTPFLPHVARGMLHKLIPQIYDLLNIKSTIAVPLLLNGRTIGLLDVSSARLFTEDDLERIENISRQLTASIQRQQANEQIRRSEAFLQSIQNALSASIAILDEEGVIVQVNAAWRKFGEQNGLQHPEYCIGMNYLEVCDSAAGAEAELASLTARAIREVITGKRHESQLEYPCHSPEEKRWYTLRITKFDDGDHIWVVLAHENITAQKEAEEAFRESSEQFRTLFEASPEAIMLIEPQGDWRILDCNETACTMNGYTRHELIGQSIDLLNLVQSDPLGRLEYLESVREAGVLRYDDYHRRKDGAVFPITVSTSLITLGGREVILGIDRDITERKKAEEALRRAEKQLELFFSQSLDGFFFMMMDEPVHWDDTVDKEKTLDHVFEHQHVTRINNAMLEQYQAREEQFLGKTPAGFFAHDLAQGRQTWRQLFDEGHLHVETDERRFDGTQMWIEGDYICLYEDDGRIAGHFGVQRDVTARKQAEQALLESEHRHRALFENVPVAIWEEDFSDVKKELDHLKEQGIADLRTYFESHPDSAIACANKIRILDVNNTAVQLFRAQSKDELIRYSDQGLSRGELEHINDFLMTIAQERTSNRWEGADETLTGEPIEISLSWSVVPGYESDYSRVIITTIDITERKQAEEELRRSHSLLYTTLESTADGILVVTPDGKVSSFNQKFLELWQVPPSLAAQKDDRTLLGFVLDQLKDPHEFIAKVEALYRSPEDFSIDEIEFIDGQVFERYSQPQRLGDTIVGRVWSFRDITERKKAEAAEREQRILAEALRDTAETLNSTLEYGEVLDHILAAAGRVVPHDAASIMLIDGESAHVARSHGYDTRGFNDEVMGIKLALAETNNLRQILETGQPVIVYDTHAYVGWKRLPATDWLRSSVGAPISIHGETIGFILLDSGTIGFFTAVHAERLKAFANQAALAIQNARLLQQAQQEIVERRQAEEELRQSERRYRTVVENQTEFIVRWTPDGTRTFANDAYCRYFGITPKQALSADFMPLVQEEDRPLVEEKISRLLSGQTGMETDIHRVIKPDGSIGWQEWTDQAIYGDSGQLVELQSVGRDITERKRAEEALRESEEKYRLLFESNPLPMWIYDLETLRFLKVNSSAIDHYGYTENEFMAMTIKDIRPPVDVPKLIKNISQVSSGIDRAGIWNHTKKDGSLIDVEIISHLVAFDGRRAELVLANDITERKRAEDKLRISEERFRQLAENIQEVFWMTDAISGEELYISPASEKIWGRPIETLLRDPNAFLETILPEDRPQAVRTIEQQRSGKKTEMEYRILRPDGSIHWVWDRAFPIFDETGRTVRLAGIAADITERKHNEAEAQRHLAELEALYENGLALGQLLDPHDVGERIIATFARHLSWHHVAIRLLRPGSDDLELIALSQPGMNADERINIEYRFQSMVSKMGQGLSGWVAQTGEPLLTGDVHAHPQYVDTHPGIRSGLYMPLKIGGRILGVISVESEEADAFTVQDERLLATLANQAAVAFENARLYQTNQQERERFSELFENTPVATWLEDFSAVIAWMHGLRAQGIIDLKKYLENSPEQCKLGVSLIDIVDVNHAAIVMNGAHTKEELVEQVHGLMLEDTPSPVMINELDLIWKGYTSFGFEMSSQKLDGSMITGIQRIYIPTTNNGPDYTRVIVTSTDITERVGFERQLRASEIHYRELADSITDIFFELDQNLHYSHWNKASEALTGLSPRNAIGKTTGEVFGALEDQKRIEQIYKEVLEKHHPRTFQATFLINTLPRNFEINAYPSTRGVAVVAKDVTERKRSETLMQKRFELMEYSTEHGLDDLMQKALDELSEWTHSVIGFFQLIKEDQITPGIQVWSTDTFSNFYSAEVKGMHKPADQAGVWAEAIHQRRAVIHNDYESMPGKKGLPEGHVLLIRELVVPIIRNERIVAVIGIGNKPQEYNRDDLEITERFADYAWDIIERKLMVIEIAEERNLLAKRVEERTSDLSRANSSLARALRVKDEFLANMSHELRTPLNAILGLSESLGEQTAGPLNDKQQKYLTTISESGHHLLSLINDILDLAKIEAGQITLDINKVDVNSVLQASLRMIKQLAQKKNLDVSVQIDKKVGLMWADERRLKQMMVNLLSNAVKFTPEGGKIGLQIDGDQNENKVEITVWDTGIGIKEVDFERLFQPFVQLDSGLARESSGTGLGLALVAQMARLHGGSVTVQSHASEGSRFTITLPWEPALTPDAVERMKVTGKFRAIRPGQSQQTILLIEDTQEVVMMIKDYLEIAGYNVATAQDGIDGIAQAKFTHPDLILMDIQMPRMDGLEATKRLRQDPQFKYTPIIALTALAMPNDRERCIAAGMDEYITKPVNLRGLVKLIQNYLYLREEKTQPR